jgi:zinc protease
MAHLFEHLMFNQTETLAAGELDRLIETVGGETNAATWCDWTHYRISLPAGQLELAARIESDRMQHLKLDDDQLEAERDVVINERLMNVDDDVEGFLDEQLMKLAFTQHPYGWPTIGWMEDIKGLPRADVHEFYRTYYAPNNACIVLVGDVDEPGALELLERYYGDIPPVELPTAVPAVEPEQTSERRQRFSKPVAADRLVLGYKTPDQSHPDWPALDLANALLTGGPSARLYRRLVVELQAASSVDGYVLPFSDPGLLALTTVMMRGHRAEQAIDELDRAIDRLQNQLVSADELAKVKNGAETDFWTSLATCDGKADALGHHETTAGDVRALFDLIEGIRAVTAADIQRVARAYLTPQRRTIVIAEPLA